MAEEAPEDVLKVLLDACVLEPTQLALIQVYQVRRALSIHVPLVRHLAL